MVGVLFGAVVAAVVAVGTGTTLGVGVLVAARVGALVSAGGVSAIDVVTGEEAAIARAVDVTSGGVVVLAATGSRALWGGRSSALSSQPIIIPATIAVASIVTTIAACWKIERGT